MKTAYITLSDFFTVFKKNMLLILIVALVLGGAAGVLRALQPADYAAEVTFYVRNPQGKEYLDTYGLTSSQLAVVQSLAKEYALLTAESGALHELLIEKHGLPIDVATAGAMITAVPDNTTFRVTVTGKDPAKVKNVADAIAAETADWINQTAWPYLYETFSCVTLLTPPAAPARSSMHPVTAGAVAALVGALLAYLFALLRFFFGLTCRDTEELMRVCPTLPLLGSLSGTPADEEIKTLRNNLLATAATLSHPVLALIGQKTVAPETLATALAEIGRKVLLVSGRDEIGLADCIAASIPLAGFALADTAPARMSLGKAPDIAKILSSFAAANELAELAAGYDLVLLDLTPLTLATATAPALAVSGYIAVATPRRTRHRALCRMLETVKQAGGSTLGMISAQ